MGDDSVPPEPAGSSEWTVFPLLRDIGPCPVCEADDVRPIHIYANARAVISAALNLAIVGCASCGIVFSHPLPSDDELDRYYGYAEGWETRISLDEAWIAQMLEVKHGRYSRQFDALEGLLQGRAAGGDNAPRSAFDFGCGLGAWLDVLKAHGWDTYGLEPGRRSAEVAAREHTMLSAIPTAPTFDLVVVNHVLEHLRDPLAVTRALAAATKPGGRIYVSVPDFGRLAEHRAFGYAANERHLYSFTSSSLRSLLALAGFELVAHSNQAAWPAAPLDKDDAKRLKTVGALVEGKLRLPADPLDEAIRSMRAYEPRAAKRLLRSIEGKQKPVEPARRPPRVRRGSRRRPIARRVRRFFVVWLPAALRAHLGRGRA